MRQSWKPCSFRAPDPTPWTHAVPDPPGVVVYGTVVHTPSATYLCEQANSHSGPKSAATSMSAYPWSPVSGGAGLGVPGDVQVQGGGQKPKEQL
jgi:hypothetical protein